VIIAFAPIFLANMVFAQRFRDTGDSSTAFGANLLGAMIGGILEYLSLIIGYRWLLAVVALLYGVAFITGRGHLRITQPVAARVPQAAGQALSGTDLSGRLGPRASFGDGHQLRDSPLAGCTARRGGNCGSPDGYW
jgi:MFS family permease